ncbi:hypothetical protein VB715_02550 [Crocosphaera sp. UHCC 0190]|uniref:hypothetical protein n=1 Tax=Crocosphaera sp. UHCC 0190 TaxID=3110246 RepID=UPI002B210559|nr:hypothetical protein [Crocosphaera sp. UHCC 0190]MEA5508635.1 hypothetical protein [Crocosphaera sp. UHCC 0190]
MVKIYLQLLQKKRSSAGWTLAELLIAAALTLVVVMAAGWGLVNILRESKVANATSEMQYDLNRAAEFITEEVRGASVIETSLTDDDFKTYAPDFNPTGKTPVLMLKNPELPQRVVYYIKDADSTMPWRGPAVLYRWGPSFTDDGTYDSDTKSDTSSWQNEALVDMMLTALDPEQKQCRNLPPDVESPNTYIATDGQGKQWYRLPQKEADVKGFFACVREDKQLAQLNIYGTTVYTNKDGKAKGQLQTVASGKENSRFDTSYEITTQAFARSEKVGSNGEDIPNYYVEPNTNMINPEEYGKAQISVLSLNIPCMDGSNADPNTVTTMVTQPDVTKTIGSPVTGTSSNTPGDFEEDEELMVEISDDGICTFANTIQLSDTSFSQPHVKYASNDSKYLQLDKIITDATERTKIATTLSSKGLLQSDGNTLKLADNQIVYFFEFEFKELDPIAKTYASQIDAEYNDAVILVNLSK